MHPDSSLGTPNGKSEVAGVRIVSTLTVTRQVCCWTLRDDAEYCNRSHFPSTFSCVRDGASKSYHRFLTCFPPQTCEVAGIDRLLSREETKAQWCDRLSDSSSNSACSLVGI